MLFRKKTYRKDYIDCELVKSRKDKKQNRKEESGGNERQISRGHSVLQKEGTLRIHDQPLPITKEVSDHWGSHCRGGTQPIKPRALPIPPSPSPPVLSIVPIPDPSWDVYSRGDSHHDLILLWLLSGKFCLGAINCLHPTSCLFPSGNEARLLKNEEVGLYKREVTGKINGTPGAWEAVK